MTNLEKNLETILSQALLADQQGKTLPEILALFPEEEQEIKEMFEIIADLDAKKDKLNPSPEILQKILTNLEGRQITAEAKKINLDNKGRLLFSLNIIKELFMTQKLKIAIPVLAVLILVVAGAYIYLGSQAGTAADVENEIAAALDSELAQEAALTDQGDANLDVALADEQIINEFNQTYDDNQL